MGVLIERAHYYTILVERVRTIREGALFEGGALTEVVRYTVVFLSDIGRGFRVRPIKETLDTQSINARCDLLRTVLLSWPVICYANINSFIFFFNSNTV